MKAIVATSLALVISAGAAFAQSDKPGMKPEAATGASEKASPGVAKDPGEVKAQQGETGKSSPGTVGAAPGADTKSQGK